MDSPDPWFPRTERGGHRGYALVGASLVGGVGIGAAFLTSAVAILFLGGFGGASLPVLVMVLFFASAIGLVSAGVISLSLRGIDVRSYVRIRVPGFRDLLWAAGGYVAALTLVFVAGIVLTLLQAQPETTNQAAKLGFENPIVFLWLVPLSIFVIAPSEEFLFRGVVQGRLREAFPATVAIPITAAIFALVHFFSLSGAPGARLIAIAILFLPSLVFGYAYERTENLIVPVLIHGAYNSTLVTMVYVTIELLGETPPPV